MLLPCHVQIWKKFVFCVCDFPTPWAVQICHPAPRAQLLKGGCPYTQKWLCYCSYITTDINIPDIDIISYSYFGDKGSPPLEAGPSGLGGIFGLPMGWEVHILNFKALFIQGSRFEHGMATAPNSTLILLLLRQSPLWNKGNVFVTSRCTYDKVGSTQYIYDQHYIS